MLDYTISFASAAGSLSGRFTWVDWLVLLGYFAVVTLLGVKLAGKQEDMDDFFLGGKGLPWYAVTGSMIATEISAVTFIGVPYIVFKEGGNFTYLQLGLIAGLIARLFVAFVLIPAYYQKRIFSPYDYMGDRLGEGAKRITTALFSLGGLLGQSSRVYLTAVVLEIVMADQLGALAGATDIGTLFWAVLIIGVVSVLWTVIGGISTVIWTDVMLFLVFVSGGVVAVVLVAGALPGGWGELFHTASEAGKFKTFDLDLSFSPTKEFTIWTAAIASVFGSIGAYGTDQLMAQRIFVCKNQTQAKIAILVSWGGQLVTALMLMVGAGLFAFYSAYPEKLTGQALDKFIEEPDRIFPIFILTELPVGLTGLIIAGIFAAAVSSMTSILAALSQTSISTVYLPLRARALGRTPAEEERYAREDDPAEGQRTVRASRLFIIGWAVALCIAAFAVDRFKSETDVPILSLALGLASYVWGGLLAAFVLAWLPINKNGRGLVWSVPLSVMMVFALRFHEPWAYGVCGVVGGFLLASWLWSAATTKATPLRTARLVKTVWLAVGVTLLVLTTLYAHFDQRDAEGNVVMVYAPTLDATGAVVTETSPAEPVLHPLTGEALIDTETGEPRMTEPQQVPVPDEARGVPAKVAIAWPWYAVVGAFTAFIFGYLLGGPNLRQCEPSVRFAADDA